MALIVTAAFASGCGSGNSRVSTNGANGISATTRAKTGSATFTIAMPDSAGKSATATSKGKAQNTRFIALGTGSFAIVLTDSKGSVVARSTVNNTGTYLAPQVAPVQFTDLAPETYTVQASAYQGSSGTGVVLSTASAPLTIVSGQDTPITLTLASTVTRVAFAAAESTAILGEDVSFTTPEGYDSAGNRVTFNDFLASADFGTSFEDNTNTNALNAPTIRGYAAAVGLQTVKGVVEGGASGTTTVNVTEEAKMVITPSEITLAPGAMLPNFFIVNSLVPLPGFSASASLNATPNISKPIVARWEISEGSVGGSVSQDSISTTGSNGYHITQYVGGGIYTAGTTPGTYHMIGHNRYDSTFLATALIHVTATGPTVTLSPATASISTGGTLSFQAHVADNSTQAVGWSVQEGAVGGSIDSNGVYTAPATPGTYHIVAQSVADLRGTGTAAVTVN